MRFHVMQMDYPESDPGGVEITVYETDDAATANREARELSVPGNACWVRDTAPKLRPVAGYQDVSHVTDADGITRRLQTPVRVF